MSKTLRALREGFANKLSFVDNNDVKLHNILLSDLLVPERRLFFASGPLNRKQKER
jgi:hypothetical protein